MNVSDDAVFARIAEQVEHLRAELERTRRDYERIMIHLSQLSATVTDKSKRTAMELMATVVATDYELKVLLLRDLEEPHDREVWEKYLALVMWATVEELPPRVGQDFGNAGKALKDSLKLLRSDQAFMKALGDIRNRVAAHRDVTNGDHWLAQCHLSAISNKHNTRAVLQSKIVAYTGTVLDALRAFGCSLLREHPDMLPERE
ncbi:hypothetical protein [Arthrobacter celericrescens]|uniref:hypothetical protein n=1 Tax=Arthrobacter celericrescens TaxID=2320851 RepID=UPI000EA21C7E|nr:hypothetical protein [Arthrobacter celericrescens]